MISKAERKRRKQESIIQHYQYYLNELEKAYRSNQRVSDTYMRLNAFRAGVMSMCQGGEYAYWQKRFNEAFLEWQEKNKKLMEVHK